MKVGIVGAGAVGSACTIGMIHREAAREVVLVDRDRQRAAAVAADVGYGASVVSAVDVREGSFEELVGADLVMITAGVNERDGGATDRSDSQGRMRLLDVNAAVFEDVVPRVSEAAPDAVIMVVTDPPDPLADLTRRLAPRARVLSTGTFIDSLRLRFHIARRLGVAPESVDALVIGEHGVSEVMLWSSATVGGVPFRDACAAWGHDIEAVRARVEHAVRYANISIIEGNKASQHGIGLACARLALGSAVGRPGLLRTVEERAA
jgi:L-lactate dehydrogenase